MQRLILVLYIQCSYVYLDLIWLIKRSIFISPPFLRVPAWNDPCVSRIAHVFMHGLHTQRLFMKEAETNIIGKERDQSYGRICACMHHPAFGKNMACVQCTGMVSCMLSQVYRHTLIPKFLLSIQFTTNESLNVHTHNWLS